MSHSYSVRPLSARRQAYLRFCMRVSLKKRLPNLLLSALLGAALGLLLTWPLWACLLAAGLGLMVSVFIVASRSWQRHRHDPLESDDQSLL